MKGLLFFVILLGIGIVLWTTSQKDGFQDLQLPSAYEDTDPHGASPSLNVPVVSPKQQMFTQADVQPFAPPSTALLAPPPGQSASVNTKPAEDPALQKATPGRIQSVYESMNGFFQRAEAGLEKLGDPSVQLPLTTARADRGRLKDELAVLVRNPGLESTLTEEGLSGIEANLAYLQRKWNMSVNAESGAPPTEGFESGSGRWSIFGWLFGEEEGFQTATQYACPTTLGPNKGVYAKVVNSAGTTVCVETCPIGYTKTASSPTLPNGTCKNTSGSEFIPDVVNATAAPTAVAVTPVSIITDTINAGTLSTGTTPTTTTGTTPTTTTGTTPTTTTGTTPTTAIRTGVFNDAAGAMPTTTTPSLVERYALLDSAQRATMYATLAPSERAIIDANFNTAPTTIPTTTKTSTTKEPTTAPTMSTTKEPTTTASTTPSTRDATATTATPPRTTEKSSTATLPIAGKSSDVKLADLEQLSLKINIEILKLEAVGSA